MGRLLLVLIASFSLALPVRAQDAKPNSLTPKEIAEGWILLFDGETTFGWKTKGPVQVRNGEVLLGGEKPASIETATQFADGVLKLQLRQGKLAQTSISVGNISYPLWLAGVEEWIDVSVTIKQGKPLVTIIAGQATANDDPIVRSVPAPIGIGSQPAKKGAEFPPVATRNIRFRPDANAPLFNGKDLTGWKVFPGKKSEFAVIDGAINIKDGPGDLQTEKQFGDFCLQLECKSHGKHLNSGVFFRCRPNEYQNGYEAQVRNQFTEKPTQKYLLEEYDPATHKLLGKKEALFTAVDFGTGAIYRRQPARKEMSKDGEWFTMTVAAHGNHLATWVNGVQVTDWFDHRPPSDNARTGCRVEAGHISLQGHDPTTNLSFRNFRIQEYPTK